MAGRPTASARPCTRLRKVPGLDYNRADVQISANPGDCLRVLATHRLGQRDMALRRLSGMGGILFDPRNWTRGVGFARKHQCPCTGSGSARHRQSLDKSEYTIAAGTLVLEHGQQVPDCCRLARRQRVNCELHAVRVPTRPSRTLVGPITVRGRRTVCGAPGGAARKTIGRPTPACVRLPAAAVSRSLGRPAPRPSTAARVIAVPLRRRAAPGQRCRRGPESDLTRPQSSARWRGCKRNSAPGCSSNRPGGSRPRRPGGLFRVTRSKVFGWKCAEPSLPGLRAACPRLSIKMIPTGSAVDF